MTLDTFLAEAVNILDRWDREKNADRNGVSAAINAVHLLTKILPPAIRHLDPDTRRKRAFTK